MKLSLFTPTHNPAGLQAAWESLRPQIDGLDWEWIILRNNGCPAVKPFHENVRVLKAPYGIKGVGALKAHCCEQATGDVFIELDHDDELLPGCLEAIAEAMEPSLRRFFYSDAWLTGPDGKAKTYGVRWGWEHYDRSPELGLINRSFPATARSLCEIFYAPNHVRAWGREAYEAAGGYDETLEVCDDQDLLIRTYLAGVEFVRCNEPLYWQKLSGKTTQSTRNAEIQKTQTRIRNQYLYRLVEEWARRSELPLYDFGGAFGCPKGWTPVDKHFDQMEDGFICDLTEFPLPWEDNSVGAIRAHDFLEHVPPDKVVALMNEIHRVLVPGGWLLSQTPSTDGRGAFQDPTHVSFWNSNSFWYYTKAAQARYVPAITGRWQQVALDNGYPSTWHEQHKILYVASAMVALKGQREPGWNDFMKDEPKPKDPATR
jgi:O-antigen biosynthesis protein